jgi:hypothetical protein
VKHDALPQSSPHAREKGETGAEAVGAIGAGAGVRAIQSVGFAICRSVYWNGQSSRTIQS